MIGLIFAAAVALSPPCMQTPVPTQHHHVAHKARKKALCGTPVIASTPLIGPAPIFITVPAEPEPEALHVVPYYIPAAPQRTSKAPPPDEYIVWEPLWTPFMLGGGVLLTAAATVPPAVLAPPPREPVYPRWPGPSIALHQTPELDVSSALVAITILAIGFALKEKAG